MMIYNIIKKTPEKMETSDYETIEEVGHFICAFGDIHT